MPVSPRFRRISAIYSTRLRKQHFALKKRAFTHNPLHNAVCAVRTSKRACVWQNADIFALAMAGEEKRAFMNLCQNGIGCKAGKKRAFVNLLQNAIGRKARKRVRILYTPLYLWTAEGALQGEEKREFARKRQIVFNDFDHKPMYLWTKEGALPERTQVVDSHNGVGGLQLAKTPCDTPTLRNRILQRTS